MLTPVTYDAAGDSRYATTAATSAGEPYRRSGTDAIICAATASGSGGKYWLPAAACAATWRSHIRPGPMKAGDTELTRMPKGARSLAADFVRPTMAAFDAE